MEQWMMIAIAAGVFCLVAWLTVTYNKLVKLKNYKEEAFATMDVYLKQRSDMLPNLLAIAKRYAEHEQAVFGSIHAIDNAQQSTSMSRTQRLEHESEVENTLKTITLLQQKYPDLKADRQFMNIQMQLAEVEDNIANARKYYNAVVKTYNTAVQQFPGSIAAWILGFRKEVMFTATSQERKNVSF